MQNTEKTIIVELDSIRGIAAMAVMVGHCLTYYQTPDWFHGLALVFNGRAAVVLFFVMSGFVLARSLGSKPLRYDSLVDYYIRRFFRLYPAVWAASLLAFFYIAFVHSKISVPNLGTGASRQYGIERFDSLHVAASLAGVLAYLLPQLWSIFVEIVASALMPFLCFVLYRRTTFFPLLFAISVVLSFTVGSKTYYNICLYIVDFVAGSFLSFIYLNIKVDGLTARLFGNPATLVLLGILASLTQFLPTPYYDPSAHIIETALSSCIVLSVVLARGNLPLLRSVVLQMLGKLSYSVYLLHYTVLCFVVRGQTVMFDVLKMNMSPVGLSLVAAVPTALFTLALSWYCFNYVELRGIRLGRKFVNFLGVCSERHHLLTVQDHAAP